MEGASDRSGLVGVVICTYQPGPIIGSVIDRICAERPGAVVVVDNSPSRPVDLTAAVQRNPEVVLIEPGSNLGFSAANNAGVRALPATDYVLFLNPDAVVLGATGFLSRAVEALDADPSIGAIGPKLVEIDRITALPTGRIDSTGIAQEWYGRFYDRGQGEDDHGQYDGPPTDAVALCAAAMLCRRSALEAVSRGGEIFDESFFMYKEDIDLSLRLRRAGWRLLYVSQLQIGHARGTTAESRRALPKTQRQRSVRNEWRIWHKRLQPLEVRAPMLGYLMVKSLIVRLGG